MPSPCFANGLSNSKCSKFPDNPEATRAFQKVSVAYDVLSKPSSKRLYDSQPPQSYDIFATRPSVPPQETFRGVIIGVFNDLLDGDLDMVRSLLSTPRHSIPEIICSPILPCRDRQ